SRYDCGARTSLWNAEPTPRSDIYSFGNIVLQVLSREQPWKNKPEAVVLQLFQERPAAEDIVPELQRFFDTSHPHLPIREHLVVSPHDHSQPASTGTSNLEGARRDPSAPADISIVQCLPSPLPVPQGPFWEHHDFVLDWSCDGSFSTYAERSYASAR
ncbi:hypothetical protein BDN67DRAFT_1001178, partial [Paxillus ammoniavirescens]